MTQFEKTAARVILAELKNHTLSYNVTFSIRDYSSYFSFSRNDIDIKFECHTGKAGRKLISIFKHIQKRIEKTKKAQNVKRNINWFCSTVIS